MPTGDTFLTLRKMEHWAKKYAHHVERLAKAKFKGQSLGNTAKAIHHFLYNHIQYQMDGELQVLKSPGCAWATRDKGTDCKTYSIFASAILQNLGIQHYFKKLKQPNPNWPYRGIDPNLWSHVYVIIPKDQKKLTVNSPSDYYVIDATVNNNKEVPATESKVKLMSSVSLPHVGLAGVSGTADCSCTPKVNQVKNFSTSNLQSNSNLYRKPSQVNVYKAPARANVALRGLGATKIELSEFEKAFFKFDLFLADLVVKKGLPVSEANAARERLVSYVEKGIEPTIKDLFGLENKAGLGNVITAPLLRDVNQLPARSRNFTRSNTNSGGVLQKVGSTVPLASTATSLISAIVPKDLFDKTFGAVFANGFNFKCWGAKWNPKRAEVEFQKDADLVKQRLPQVLNSAPSQLEKAINDFWIWFYGLKSTQRNWLNTSAKDCTKDGLKILIGAHDGLAAQSKLTIEQWLTGAGHKISNAQPHRKTYPPESTGRHAWTFDVPQYKVMVNTNTGSSNFSGNSTVNRSVGTRSGNVLRSGSFVDENNRVVFDDQPNQTQNANFGWIAVGALALVAIGAMAFKGKEDKKKQLQTSK